MSITEWKDRVIDALVVTGAYRAAHEDNPLLALADLIASETSMALDPKVSQAAEELVALGRREGASPRLEVLAFSLPVEWFERILTAADIESGSVDQAWTMRVRAEAVRRDIFAALRVHSGASV